ncbi:MAG: cysteine desulfurase family protein, partial [Parachlamydiaceae bacterium]
TDIHAIAESIKVPFVVDGVQWLGKEKMSLPKNLFGIGFSGHKIHAPPGIGFAIVKQPMSPSIIGGAQEFGKRGGTENMIGIAALKRAIEIMDYPDSAPRDTFESMLIEKLPVKINGKNRVATTSNITFANTDGETLLIKLDQAGVAASLGSACSSGAIEPSRVLLSMGLSYKEAKSSLRFSFSRMNTIEEAKRAAKIVIESLK